MAAGIVRGMEAGLAALAFGLVAFMGIEMLPRGWLRAGGGALLLFSLCAIALQLLGVL